MTFSVNPTSAGANPLYWTSLQDLLGEADIPIVPDASYSEYAETVELASGALFGRGFPSAEWRMTVTGLQRKLLRDICAGVSVPVYIETYSNEYDAQGVRQFIQASAIMKWTTEDETIDADVTTNLTIRFTHIVEIV